MIQDHTQKVAGCHFPLNPPVCTMFLTICGGSWTITYYHFYSSSLEFLKGFYLVSQVIPALPLLQIFLQLFFEAVHSEQVVVLTNMQLLTILNQKINIIIRYRDCSQEEKSLSWSGQQLNHSNITFNLESFQKTLFKLIYIFIVISQTFGTQSLD